MSGEHNEGPETLEEESPVRRAGRRKRVSAVRNEGPETLKKAPLVKRVWRWYGTLSLVDNIRQMLQKPARIPSIDFHLIVGKVIPILAIVITVVWLALALTGQRIRIIVTNNGCEPIFFGKFASQNGLADYFVKLPDQVAKGASGTVEMNQLLGQFDYVIDASTPGTLTVSPSILGADKLTSQKFPVHFDNVLFDDQSFMNRKLYVNLTEGAQPHQLLITCGKT
jgi:hypothetical protein